MLFSSPTAITTDFYSSSSSESTTSSSFATNACTGTAVLCVDAATYQNSVLPDQSGNGNDLSLFGNANFNPAVAGGVLNFSGSGYLALTV